MSLTSQVQDDLKQAMKARASERVSALRMLLSELKKAALEADELSDADEVALVQRALKQRREAAEAFDKGGRAEMAAKERAEAEFLSVYLPQQLSDDELREAVAELIAATGASSPRDVGRVMGPLLKKYAGRLDGNRARQAVQAALASA